MLIRYGYEITVNCWQPTPMVALMTIRDERAKDVRAPEVFSTNPAIPSSTYRDVYGNVCRRFIAPAGDLTLFSDSVIFDKGELDSMLEIGTAAIRRIFELQKLALSTK